MSDETSVTDALEAKGYKDVAIAELVAMRGRHSVATALKNYVEVKQRRVRKAVDELSNRPSEPLVSEAPTPKSTVDRLKELKVAHDEGLLSDAEYETYRRRAIDALVQT